MASETVYVIHRGDGKSPSIRSLQVAPGETSDGLWARLCADCPWEFHGTNALDVRGPLGSRHIAYVAEENRRIA